MKRISIVFMLCAWCLQGLPVKADTKLFGHGENQFAMEFVTIGDPGNPPDDPMVPALGGDFAPRLGAVDYVYEIGKFEVARDAVSRAIAAGWNDLSSMSIEAFEEGGVWTDSPEQPVIFISWLEAAHFVNWLNESSGFPPAYRIDDQNMFQLWNPPDTGYNEDNRFRNSLARYVLPTADEWHKAAFYDPASGTYFDYATGSNDPPTLMKVPSTAPNTIFLPLTGEDLPMAPVTMAGGLSPYGTMAQAGNAGEWEESRFDLQNDLAGELAFTRGLRLGWTAGFDQRRADGSRRLSQGEADSGTGMRVAAVWTPLLELDCNGDERIDGLDLACILDWGRASEANVPAVDFLNRLLTATGLTLGDVNGDGSVDFADFLVVNSNFGQSASSYAQGDIDADGQISFSDYLILASNFGIRVPSICPGDCLADWSTSTAAVPEPMLDPQSLLAVAIAGWRISRRRVTKFARG